MFNLSFVPGNALLIPMAIVPAGLCARASVCFGVLNVSLNALEPDVAFPVQPLQALWARGVWMYRGRGPSRWREV